MATADLFNVELERVAADRIEYRAPLFEQYRPKTWADVVGQDKAVSRLLAIRDRGGFGGRAFFISGASGTGKTTTAKLIAGEVADEFNVEEIDAQDATPARLRDLERDSYSRAIGAKSGRAFIINEAHALRRDSIRQLLVMLERVPAHVVWIFTTTTDGQETLFEDCDDAGPLLSRCLRVELARRDLAKAFAERCRQIAQAEGLDGRPIAQYVRLIQGCRNNLRAALQAIEAGQMLD